VVVVDGRPLQTAVVFDAARRRFLVTGRRRPSSVVFAAFTVAVLVRRTAVVLTEHIHTRARTHTHTRGQYTVRACLVHTRRHRLVGNVEE